MARVSSAVLQVGAGVALVALVGAGAATRSIAHHLLTNPPPGRLVSDKSPADPPWNVPAQAATVTSADGTTLRGWFIPTDSPRLVLVQHGYKERLQSLYPLAALFHRHGYQVMLMSLRGHDHSDGEMFWWGQREMPDIEAWSTWARAQPGVDSARVGMIGISMGGMLAIQYTATHPEVRALVASSAFSSLSDTMATSVRAMTGLPPFPFAPMITFWAEREGGFEASAVDATQWIGQISPRPVLLLQGGADQVASPSSREKLFAAAGEPKELWFEPALGHGQFLARMPDEFERRVIGFFDEYLQ